MLIMDIIKLLLSRGWKKVQYNKWGKNMKRSKLLGIINFFIVFLVFFIAYKVLKIKTNIINSALIGLSVGILIYLYPKLLDRKK